MSEHLNNLVNRKETDEELAEKRKAFEAAVIELQETFGYEFQNHELLEQAVTAPGFGLSREEYHLGYETDIPSNAELESAGDKIHRSEVTRYLKICFPNVDQEVSRNAASTFFNSNVFQSTIAFDWGVDKCLRVPHGIKTLQTRANASVHERGEIGFETSTIRLLSNTYEAILAAAKEDAGENVPAEIRSEIQAHINSMADLFRLSSKKRDRTFSEIVGVKMRVDRDIGRKKRKHTIMILTGYELDGNGKQVEIYEDVVHFETGQHMSPVLVDAALFTKFFNMYPWLLWGEHTQGAMSLRLPGAANSDY